MSKVWTPTPEILDRIKELAAERVSEADIAKAVGIGESTWYKKKNEFPEIVEALAMAKRSKVVFARSKLWSIIEDDDHKNQLQAITFFLKNYDDEINQAQTTQAPTIQLPTGFNISLITPEQVAAQKGENE